MKKIDFGVNNDRKLNASFSEISPYNGEYMDLVSCNGFDFLITRIIDSYKGLNGSIDVREVAQDYYPDGSYVNYANQEKNTLCQKFEQLLNTQRVRDKLTNGENPLRILKEAGFPVGRSSLRPIEPVSETFSSIVTSVKDDKFQSLKESKQYRFGGGKSMYDMSQELLRLRAEIERLKSGEHTDDNHRYR